ncbi:MAG: aryl-sulfate sulfotransferase [Planctomycetota bacterium]
MHSTNAGAAAALAVVLLAELRAQAPGHRLYDRVSTGDTYLVDTAGTIVHTWPGRDRGHGLYLDGDGSLLRTPKLPGAPAFAGGAMGGIERVAFDGTVAWRYQVASPTQWAHHDIAIMPNGNILMIAWDLMSQQEAFDAGRDPALLPFPGWRPDGVVEIRPTGPTSGDIVWEWHVMDHLIQDFDATKANFGVVADHPELLDINFPREISTNGEFNHCNAIDYDPSRNLIVVSFPYQREVYLIDHSTTTAEAAGSVGGRYGQGGDILYRWGNPQAYRAGTPEDQKLWFHHGTHFIPPGRLGAGNLLIFNNQAGVPFGMRFSSVVELDLPATLTYEPGVAWGPRRFAWEYINPTPTAFYSAGKSNAERLPNGNTLVCSSAQSWLFEVRPDGQIAWEHRVSPPATPFRTGYYERSLWTDRGTSSAARPLALQLDLLAGSPRAGDVYVMLGSASGTTPGARTFGVTLPLNPDPYLRLLYAAAATRALPTFVGTLDPRGGATATLTLPPEPALAGLTLHHAFAAVAPRTTIVSWVSNAVPLRLMP